MESRDRVIWKMWLAIEQRVVDGGMMEPDSHIQGNNVLITSTATTTTTTTTIMWNQETKVTSLTIHKDALHTRVRAALRLQ